VDAETVRACEPNHPRTTTTEEDPMDARRTAAALAAGTTITAGVLLAGCGSPAPSAQCLDAVAQVGQLQAEAQNAISVNDVNTFAADGKQSGELLNWAVKHCPNSGYPSGRTLR
jgi:hypothetical protein